MKKSITKRHNIYWFFRSLFISLLIVFCLMFLFLGGAECYTRMKTTITGKVTRVLEQKDGHIFFLGNDIGETPF